MKLLMWSCVLLASFPGGERERGIELYRQGKYAEAQAQFAKALEREPDSAELQWNLALAAWRAGDLETAEIAADKYSASSQAAKGHLYRGLRGAVRYAEAERFEQRADAALAAPGQPLAAAADDEEEPAEPLPLLEKALQQAMQARIEFTKGVRDQATPELIRNTERALRKVEELKKRIEELRQQQEQQQPKQDGDQDEAEQKPEEAGDDSDDKQSPGDDEQQKQPQPKPEAGEPEGEGAESNEPQNPDAPDPDAPDPDAPDPDAPEPDEPKEREPNEQPERGESTEPPPPPSGEPEQAPEPQPAEPTPDGDGQPGEPPDVPEQLPEPQPAEPDGSKPPPEPSERRDAPGEQAEGRELSPEETQRLMELLRKLDGQLRQARQRGRVRRPKVERDW